MSASYQFIADEAAIYYSIISKIGYGMPNGELAMKLLRSMRFLLAALPTLLCATFAFAQEAPLQGFDDYINKALKD